VAVEAGISEEVLPVAAIPSRARRAATTKIGAESATFTAVENDPTQLDPVSPMVGPEADVAGAIVVMEEVDQKQAE
jgi:hypothetical protein